jgi:sugar lactone lactonase YvrE
MYFADTYRKSIWVFDYDLGTGTIANRRLFSDLSNQPGRPDGSAVDAEGCLWNCEYAGGRVVRYTPDGTVDHVVTVPCDNPTCCAFGGPDLRTLYITSARQRLTPEQLDAQPLAGSVFAVRTGTSGMVEARFGG